MNKITKLLLLTIMVCLVPSALALPTLNELPLYGGITKSPQQIEADQKFIAEAIKAANGRENATDQIIRKGWEAIQTKDLPLAIRRFNQGFLLAPNDYRVYWGLGTTVAMQGEVRQAEALFAKGAALNPKDIRFLCDYGFSIQEVGLMEGRGRKDPRETFNRAAKVFADAMTIDPRAALPHSRMAVIHYYLGRCAEAKSEVDLSIKQGSEGLDPRFVADLGKNCP